jgi:pilus assembly protein CpaB
MKAAGSTPSNRVVRRIRIRAILFLVLALGAGVGAVFLVRGYLARLRSGQQAAVAPAKVVVAALDISIGTPLTKEHLTVTDWPASTAPAGHFADPNTVIGRTPISSLLKGEPILAARLADEKAGRGLAALLKKGTRAMGIKVDQVIGVAGFVQPGDYVDVITTMSPDEETRKALGDNSARVSKIVLQNIRVLSVGEHMTTQGNKPVPVQVVSLEVTPDQSERLTLASRYGEIQLTIRSGIDQEQVSSSGITPVALLAPDDGKMREKKVLAAADTKPSDKQWAARAAAARRRTPKKVPEKAEAKPELPVVEVLRGDKVEERKMKPTADTK